MMKTLVLGASPKSNRYSYQAVARMKRNNISVVAVGFKEGNIEGESILTGKPPIDGIDTVSLYLSAANQKDYYSYILELKPRRIIFNPGAENSELEKLASEKRIEVLNACTLTMLAVGNY